ncbi:MAG: hypothetical protein JNL18_17935 [Planctomycetaceae bacterium]|nr:hypothetical protein [Planctomycetaceae bacterium]
MPQSRKTRTAPLIGIWWDDGSTLVALTHSPAENASAGPLIDSELNHFEQWEKIASRFGLSSDDEYFEVPRGRVLLKQQTGEGLIYHGNATTPARLRAIAARYKLTKWTTQRNEHYDVGPDADALFAEAFDDD